jgi:hypothetical protein
MVLTVVARRLCRKAMDLLALVGSFDREERAQGTLFQDTMAMLLLDSVGNSVKEVLIHPILFQDVWGRRKLF